jgi:hypothetical protein
VFLRGVSARNGHGVPAKKVLLDERRSRPERSFAALGQNERPRKNTDKTGPVKTKAPDSLQRASFGTVP